MVQQNTQIIQAFPIQANTYVGVLSDFQVHGHKILHATEDGTITFDMGTSGSVAVEVLAGQDLSFSNQVVSITSTGTCWVS